MIGQTLADHNPTLADHSAASPRCVGEIVPGQVPSELQVARPSRRSPGNPTRLAALRRLPIIVCLQCAARGLLMGGAPLLTLIDELSARLRSDDEPAARHAFPQSATAERPRRARARLNDGVAGRRSQSLAETSEANATQRTSAARRTAISRCTGTDCGAINAITA